jgi:1A family penicillin-binding protein
VPDPLSGQQQPVSLDDIPLALRQATIAIEDRTFYDNPGIDARGIARAFWHNLQRGEVVAGGSTITQQLARNFLLDPQLARQRTLERKIREAVLALRLTATYPKDEILALYLNQTYYGGLRYGVEAAAQHYFGKPVRDLDLAECALLAGLPQAPSHYDPFANPQAATARQHAVLAAMVQAGALSPAQAAAARAEPLQFAATPDPLRAPHFVRYVLDILDARLGADVAARGGLTITTTLDLDVQAAARQSLRHHLDRLAHPRPGLPDHNVHNGAVVVLDPADGAILAMVGSPDYHDASIQGQFNAALALRQPGSALKPLLYAAALERGWTPATTLLDVPTTFRTREGRPYAPQNYDRTFHGPLSLRTALATSSNVAAVATLDEMGVPALLEMAERLGVASLGRSRGRSDLALALGGGEVSLLEMTGAYAVFANGGRAVAPASILAIARTGSPPPANPDPPAASSPVVLSPAVAFLISDMLADPYARLPAFGARSVLDVGRPAAAKTGTTTGWRDNWTVGFSPDRVVGVWVGNADGQPMHAVSGISGAGPVWHDVMLAAHRNLPPHPFERPANIVEVRICAEGGGLPGPHCPATRLERFVAGTQPTRPNNTHVALTVDQARNCRVVGAYPANRTTTRVYRLLPPEAEPWAIEAGIPRPPTRQCPPQAGDIAQASYAPVAPPVDTQAAPALLEPAPGAMFALSNDIPRAHQRIELHARAGTPGGALTILIDGAQVAHFTGPPYRVLWEPTPGTHRAVVEVRDATGHLHRSAETTFIVEEP